MTPRDQRDPSAPRLSIDAAHGASVHLWWSDDGASIAIDLGGRRGGALAHLAPAVAAYVAAALAYAAGVQFTDLDAYRHRLILALDERVDDAVMAEAIEEARRGA